MNPWISFEMGTRPRRALEPPLTFRLLKIDHCEKESLLLVTAYNYRFKYCDFDVYNNEVSTHSLSIM